MIIKERKESNNSLKIIIITVLCTILTLVLGFIIWYRLGGFKTLNNDDSLNNTSENFDVTDETTSETEPEIENKYDYIEVPNERVRSGELILINENYEHIADNADIVNIYENKSSRYAVSEYNTSAKAVVVKSLNGMFEDFYTATSIDDVIINSAYRTRALQEQLYSEGDPEYVARPGYSEHETGYAVDLGIYDGYTLTDFDGKGEYAWFNDNCYKYGFILRYPENMKPVTKINYEPWHFRYIGTPHAYYIMKNQICFEEYIELLDNHMFTEEHFFTQGHDGTEYEIYVFPADYSAPATTVPVPADREYTISGNNINGFIITIKCN